MSFLGITVMNHTIQSGQMCLMGLILKIISQANETNTLPVIKHLIPFKTIVKFIIEGNGTKILQK